MRLIFVLIVWRLLLVFIAAGTHQFFEFTPQYPYSDVYQTRTGMPPWVWSWANFDGVHYLTIAKEGYMAKYTQAFFPLYPLLLRFLADGESRFLVTGLYVSFFSLVIAIAIFRKLLLLDYSKQIMQKVILFTLLSPLSFYFSGVYTESLFLVFILAAFLFARQKKWWLCAIFGALASATRITGIFLLPALLWEYYLSEILSKNGKVKRKFSLATVAQYLGNAVRSPVFIIVPLGLFAYMLYLYLDFGDALYFWHAQEKFGAERSGATFVLPFQVVFRYLKIFATVSLTNYGFWVALGELFAFLSGVALLIFAHLKKVRFSYLLFSWLVILIPAFTGTFSSIPRYLLMAFPLNVAIVLLTQKGKAYFVMLFFSTVLFLILSSLFLRGLWVA